MELKTQLDEYSGTADTGTSYRTVQTQAPKKKSHIGIIIVGVLAALGILGSIAESGSEEIEIYDPPESGYVINYNENSNVSLFGEEVSLVKTGEGEYALAPEGETGDRVMYWSDYDDSYYEAESDCWIWYNTDMDPAVWQYWYEGISSDFGDYGWMEHDDTGWYIEASNGNWIKLPERYSTEGLWYIAD